jgi:hypothetical protein
MSVFEIINVIFLSMMFIIGLLSLVIQMVSHLFSKRK